MVRETHVHDVWRRRGGAGPLDAGIAALLASLDVPTLEEAAELVVRLHGRLDADLWEQKARMTGSFLREVRSHSGGVTRRVPPGFDPFSGDERGRDDRERGHRP